MISTKRKGDSPIVAEAMAIMDTAAKEGAALLEIAAAEPTLDRYLDHSPKTLKITDYRELVQVLQRKRAIFITAEQKKKEPKIEGENDGVTEEA